MHDTRLSAWLPGFTLLIWRRDKIEREDDPQLVLFGISNCLKWGALRLFCAKHDDCRKRQFIEQLLRRWRKTFTLEVGGKQRRLKSGATRCEEILLFFYKENLK